MIFLINESTFCLIFKENCLIFKVGTLHKQKAAIMFFFLKKQGFLKHVKINFLINYYIFLFFLKKSADFDHFWKFDVFAKNGCKYFSQMDLKADFWHGKVKTYLVSYKLFKFYAKPKKSANLAHFRIFAKKIY